MNKIILFSLCLLVQCTTNSSSQATKKNVDSNGNETTIYEENDNVWHGPGVYYGVWFANEEDYGQWQENHPNNHNYNDSHQQMNHQDDGHGPHGGGERGGGHGGGGRK